MTNQAIPASRFSGTYPLTENTTPAILQTVPESKAIRHDYLKQTKGGNVSNTQPPFSRGFFMPAISGDCTYLPGVVDYKIPSRGKVHSVSFGTLQGTRQLYCCPYLKQSKEKRDMQTNTHSTATPVASATGLTANIPPKSNERCLLHSTTLLDTITQAKKERNIEGRGNAYVRLLAHFHHAIIPGFLTEGGSLSEAARLLGIHRETLRNYATQAGINISAPSGKGGAL